MNRLNEKINVDHLPKLILSHGLDLFSRHDKRFNLNIINIRSRETKAGKFDDVQVVFWFWKGKLEWKKYDVTTDPGVPYLLKPLNKAGAAIVKPGQYLGVWQIGKHKGKYDALVQSRSISVMRDNNRDYRIDSRPDFYMTGMYGINCHRASKYGLAERVGWYSAGCCVHQDPQMYEQFIKICKEAAMNWGNSFTATWLTERDYDYYVNSIKNEMY